MLRHRRERLGLARHFHLPVTRTTCIGCLMLRDRRNESDLLTLYLPFTPRNSVVNSPPSISHRSPQEPAASPRHEPPRNRPTLRTEHRPKLMRTVRSRIDPLQRIARTIRHIALKNVPYRRKTTCCSLKPPGKCSPKHVASPNQVAGTVQG